MMLRHLGWFEAADLIISSIEATIRDQQVTYDFARLVDGATEVSCSAFGQAMIDRMYTTVLIDLSHRITDGMLTYPGLPAPVIGTHLSREAAEEIYGPGITFHIGLLTICTNTGTYIDVPFHRYADGHDLADLALEQVAGLPAVLLDRRACEAITLVADELRVLPVRGARAHGPLAALRHRPLLRGPPPSDGRSSGGARARRCRLRRIDSLNIDGTSTGERPVHSILLKAGIPIVEHLTNLAALPPDRFTFTAVPPKIEGAGTFTVRAFATT